VKGKKWKRGQNHPARPEGRGNGSLRYIVEATACIPFIGLALSL